VQALVVSSDGQITSLLPLILSDIVRQPVEAIPLGNDREARFFRIFQERTSHELAGAFHLSLWYRLVLQASRDEPFARHAIVALAALNMAYKARALKSKPDSPTTFGDPDEHHSFALAQYDKALKYMRTTISDPCRDLWKALLSCLLVYCFESFQGRKDLAITQAQTGQRLLQDRMNSRIVSKERGCILEIDIISAFVRLDLLLLTAFDTRSRALHGGFSYVECVLLSKMPSTFKDIATANMYLELLIQKIGHFLAAALGFQGPSDPSEEIPMDLRETLTNMGFGLSVYCYQGIAFTFLSQHRELTAKLNRWVATFELLAEKDDEANKDSARRLAMARLHIHYRVMKIVLAATMSDSEMVYDDYLPGLQAVVSYALPIIEHEAKVPEASFNFDLSIIAPLGFIAMRCRDWEVRREALRILGMETLKSEVFWERGMLLGLAKVLMETEEQGLGFGEKIPEERRARVLSVKKDESGSCASVKIILGNRCQGERAVVRTKLIRW
jgi:hypothetical protein